MEQHILEYDLVTKHELFQTFLYAKRSLEKCLLEVSTLQIFLLHIFHDVLYDTGLYKYVLCNYI